MKTKHNWLARLGGAATVGLATVLLGVAASAEPPLAITDRVTDPNGFLDASQTQEAHDALSAAAEDGLALYAVAVPTFDGQDATGWCLQTGEQSHLAGDSVIFAVAYEQRDAAWCTGADSNQVSDSELNRAFEAARSELGRSNPLQPEDLTAAIVTFGERVSASANGSSSGSSVGALVWVAIAIMIAAVLAVVVSSSRRGARLRKAGLGPKASPAAQQKLVDESSQQLLYADEALRRSEDELSFATAQFGTLETKSLATAIEAAKPVLQQAFEVLSRMNDEPNLAAKAQLAGQIQELVGRVMPAVATAQKVLKDRRERERTAEQQAAQLSEQIGEADRRLEAARAELQSLQQHFSASSLASIANNPDQAKAELTEARVHVAQVQQLVATDRTRAVQELDLAATALAQALRLIETVTGARTALEQSAQVLTEAIASISSDLDDVARLSADRASFAPLVDEAKAAIEAGIAARSGQGDPLLAIERLRLAEDGLDRALAPLRSAHDQFQKDTQTAQQRIAGAQTLVSQAQAQLQAHGAYATMEQRNSVAKAQSLLTSAQSLLESEPGQAAQQATQAESFARSALATAPQPAGRRSSGMNMSDVFLWSMILGNMGGGRSSGGHNSGWGGGSSWGGSSGSSWRGSSGGFGGGGGFSGGRGGSSGF